MGHKTDNTAIIRPLGADDLAAVIALDLELSGFSRKGFFEKRLRAALQVPKDYVYVGLHTDGHLDGFAMARLVNGEFGKSGTSALLDAIGVEPGQQNHGVGHKLLGEIKQILTHKGVAKLESQVDWADRSLLAFFGDTGFSLAPRVILERSTDRPAGHSQAAEATKDGVAQEINHSSPDGDAFEALARDRVPVRSMQQTDLAAIIRIDRKLSGYDRPDYYQRKLRDVLTESGVRVSLVAEQQGFAVGFIMARVDFGEFGQTIKAAAMDTVGVDPGYQGQGIGKALMAQLVSNLSALRVEKLRTEVTWDDVSGIAFFSKAGFAPTQRISLRCPL